jgi:hypothetical protein
MKTTNLLRRLKMFEEVVSDAVKMLILLFWVTITFVIIWGALWARVAKKSKINS